MPELNHDVEGELEDIFADETQNSNLENGDSMSIEAFNQANGTTFKSWDAIAKSLKQNAKEFAEAGKKKNEVVQEARPMNSNLEEIEEEVLLTRNPEAIEVLDELKEIAKAKGISPIKLYRESNYFKGEAKLRFEEKNQRNEAKRKVGIPNFSNSSNNFNFNEIEPSNKEHIEALKKAGKYEEYKKHYFSSLCG